MSANTSIQWTDRTWNPVRGCSVVSPGCINCYAMKQAHRFSGEGKAYAGLTKLTKAGPQWTGVVRTVDSALLEPLSWRKPQRIFVNSMSDLFHKDVPDKFIEQVFSVMALAERHIFQVLTKRPERMLSWFRARRFDVKGYAILQTEIGGECLYAHPWPLPNVWLGVSVENQQYADERIPLLLQTPAAVRFLSIEPQLGPVDLTKFLWTIPGARLNALHWLIVGGESGAGARPFDLQWARWVIQQGRAAGVPVFVKQLGADPRSDEPTIWPNGRITPYPHLHPHLTDRKGGDMQEWPDDLRVREFPKAVA